MNIETDTYDKEISITLLSNGSLNLFEENSLTFFSNKLHTQTVKNDLQQYLTMDANQTDGSIVTTVSQVPYLWN